MLTIWGRRSAFNVQKVLWFIDELRLAHKHIDLGGKAGGLDDPAFRAKNPHGRVPVIDDHGTVVWESHTILRYIAARHGKDGFWRDDPAQRALYEGWMDWAQTTLQPEFLGRVFWGFYRTPQAQRDAAAVARAVARCADHFLLLDTHLANRQFMLGDALSLADIPIGTHLYRYFGLEIDRPPLPHVDAWYQRLTQRPAYQRHVMIPFDDLYGRLDY